MSSIKNNCLVIGKPDAPIAVEIFLNLACPDCVIAYELIDTHLSPYINNGQATLIIKHYDKPKIALLNGTLINLYLDYSDTEKSLRIIKDLFKNFTQWQSLSNIELKNYLATNYELTEQPSNTELSLLITAEAIERNVTTVPTIFINGEYLASSDESFKQKIELTILQKLK